MIPRNCKRLAELDFPIATVGKHAIREKPIVRNHPQSIQQWWARRPLAACRAVLLGLLLPDPADPLCPAEFKSKARELLRKVPGRLGNTDLDLRNALLKFIGDFANWELSSHATYLEVGRGLVKAAHPEEPPLVVDPFAGGGSIPLEALRLGCEAFASDLNPVACLILKVMLEDIPRHGPQLAEELRRVGAQIKAAAERELAQYYPADPDGARPIAYLWARTVRCESPQCGAEIPLVRSFWLCKKTDRKRALRLVRADRSDRSDGSDRSVRFELFTPARDDEVPPGTVSRANATCPCCGVVLPAARVRAQLAAQRGGADVLFDERGRRIGGARLLAVVTLKDGEPGRHYRLATDRDYEPVWLAQQAVAQLPPGTVPDEPTPAGGGAGAGRAFSVQRYGMLQWGDLFTARQKLTLATLGSLVGRLENEIHRKLVAFVLSRLSDRLASLLGWDVGGEKLGHVFNRQALPIVWDYTEGAPFADASGSYQNVKEQIEGAVDSVSSLTRSGQAQIADACASPLPDDACSVWFTDPPYYDAVPYADLSDFFFVWLKRTLPGHPLLRDPFDPANPLTPKTREAVQDEVKEADGRPKDKGWFEETMAKAFAEGRRVLKDDGIGCVVFAHKTTEGWEALLSGMIRGGWTITGSWPIATERPGRLRSQASAALATSVHLICRPRTDDAVGDWSAVSRELPQRVRDWMERLEREGVRGADLVFACIGPALEIYSRYAKVVDAEDREIPLGGDSEAREPHRRGFLAYVWEVVGRIALEQVLGSAEARATNGVAGALEEDARLTALFLWALQTTAGDPPDLTDPTDPPDPSDQEEEEAPKPARGFSLVFDVVRRFAQPLGIHLPDWEGRIIATEKGVVRLLPVHDRAEQLFGKEGAQAIASRLERETQGDAQLVLFPDRQEAAAPRVQGRRRRSRGEEAVATQRAATTLDRVHAAMLLQASGKSNALRAMLQAERERGPEFLRLANALSALYPRDSEEKRLLDAMLLAMPR